MGWAVRRKAEGSGEDAHGIARSGRRWSASRAGRGPLVSRRGISHRAYPPNPTAHKEQETTPPQNQEAGDRGFREPNGKGWKTDFGPTPHAQTEELRPQEGETQRSSWPGWGVSPPLKGCAGQVLGYLLPPLSLPQPPALPSPSSAFTVAPVPTSGEVPVSPLPSGTPLSKCWLHPWVERGGLRKPLWVSGLGWEVGESKEAQGAVAGGFPPTQGLGPSSLQRGESPLCGE